MPAGRSHKGSRIAATLVFCGAAFCAGVIATPASAEDDLGLTVGPVAPQGEQVPGAGTIRQKPYQLGVNLNLGDLQIGGGFGHHQDAAGPGVGVLDQWFAGIGAGYTLNDWTLGLELSHLDQSLDTPYATEAFQEDSLTLTGSYLLSPGISIGGEVGYSWIDSEAEVRGGSGAESDPYRALEIGIGTKFTF